MRETWFDPWVGKIPWRRDGLPTPVFLGFPCGSAGKESACNTEDPGSIPGSERAPWRRDGLPTPVFLGFLCDSAGKESAHNAGDLVRSLGWEEPPGEGKGYPLQYSWDSPVAQLVKNPPTMRETWFDPWVGKSPLEKGKATHSSILAWRMGHQELETSEQLSLSLQHPRPHHHHSVLSSASFQSHWKRKHGSPKLLLFKNLKTCYFFKVFSSNKIHLHSIRVESNQSLVRRRWSLSKSLEGENDILFPIVNDLTNLTREVRLVFRLFSKVV